MGSYLLSTSCPVPIIQELILVCKWTASNDRQCTYQLHSQLEDVKEETKEKRTKATHWRWKLGYYM